MEINLKKKVMLAVLAGSMLCANGAFAAPDWYGTSDNRWTTVQGNAGTTGLRLTINADTKDVSGNDWSGKSNIYGSYSGTTNLTNNVLDITGGTFTGLTNILVGCAGSDDIAVTDSTLNVSGGTFTNVSILGVGYSPRGELKNNTLNITDGDLTGVSYIYSVTGNHGLKENNIVNISGGKFKASVDIRGANSSNSSELKGNKVYISGGDFTGGAKIYGASANTYGCTIQNNLVDISGGTFGGNLEIYGAFQNNATAYTGNTVTISGGNFDSVNTNSFKIAGGTSNADPNTLNLKMKMSKKVGFMYYFQKFDFTLPSGIVGGETMLSVDKFYIDGSNTSSAEINVYAAPNVTLKAGDRITLIKADRGSGIYNAGDVLGGDDVSKIVFKVGSGEELENTSGLISGDSLLEITLVMLKDFSTATGGSEDQQKAPVEGVAAAAAIVNASADLASGEGMSSLVANTAGGTDTFGAMSAGSSKYKTGSHVDVDGWGVIVGAGTTKEWDNGNATTYGLFFEYGKGDFDTYNGNVHGDGNAENKGVGIMIRHQLANNTYFEGNVRYGKQETEWSESELGGYETDSKYHGAMVGFGKIYKKGNNKLDTYLRYAYGHVGACDATLKDSDYHFESVKSHRVRTGVRYTFGQRETGFKPYIGAAWEHEFNGEAKATIRGMGEAPAPSMRGNTGIFELGFDWDDDSKWVVGLGANAYVGKRKGWDGMARVFYNF